VEETEDFGETKSTNEDLEGRGTKRGDRLKNWQAEGQARAQTEESAGRGTGGRLKNWQAEGQARAQTEELAGRGAGEGTV
jgi:hypothetical protein